jgi:hypothetical protein
MSSACRQASECILNFIRCLPCEAVGAVLFYAIARDLGIVEANMRACVRVCVCVCINPCVFSCVHMIEFESIRMQLKAMTRHRHAHA